MHDSKARRWGLFVVGGGFNTALTYAIYLALNTVIAYHAAYFLAYATGIVFSYWFNATFVFHTPLSWKGLATYPSVYIVQYVVSALLLGALVESGTIGERIAPLLVTALMVPLTYIMSKFVLGLTRRTRPEGEGRNRDGDGG